MVRLQLDQNNANVWQNLGSLYYEQEEYLKALDCLNKVLIIDSSQAVYHYTTGLILEKIDINKAIESYETAIELNSKLVDAYTNLGNIFVSQNEIDKAEEVFKQAIAANPFDFTSYTNLANLLLDKRQQIDEAISYYEKALTFNAINTDILNNLSLAYKLKNNQFQSLFYEAFSLYSQREYEEAIKLYKQAISSHDFMDNLPILFL